MSSRSLLFYIGMGTLLSGCSKYYYNPAPQVLPQYVNRIAVRPFTNKTQRSDVTERITMAVNIAFNRDGRWKIVEESQADGVLIGEITRYILIPTKRDVNDVNSEYKLTILVDISLYDTIKSQTLWTERNMEATITFARTSTGEPGGLMLTEAQDKLAQTLANDIATRTFEGFGSVTGASEKKVGTSQPRLPGNLDPAPPAN